MPFHCCAQIQTGGAITVGPCVGAAATPPGAPYCYDPAAHRPCPHCTPLARALQRQHRACGAYARIAARRARRARRKERGRQRARRSANGGDHYVGDKKVREGANDGGDIPHVGNGCDCDAAGVGRSGSADALSAAFTGGCSTAAALPALNWAASNARLWHTRARPLRIVDATCRPGGHWQLAKLFDPEARPLAPGGYSSFGGQTGPHAPPDTADQADAASLLRVMLHWRGAFGRGGGDNAARSATSTAGAVPLATAVAPRLPPGAGVDARLVANALAVVADDAMAWQWAETDSVGSDSDDSDDSDDDDGVFVEPRDVAKVDAESRDGGGTTNFSGDFVSGDTNCSPPVRPTSPVSAGSVDSPPHGGSPRRKPPSTRAAARARARAARCDAAVCGHPRWRDCGRFRVRRSRVKCAVAALCALLLDLRDLWDGGDGGDGGGDDNDAAGEEDGGSDGGGRRRGSRGDGGSASGEGLRWRPRARAPPPSRRLVPFAPALAATRAIHDFSCKALVQSLLANAKDPCGSPVKHELKALRERHRCLQRQLRAAWRAYEAGRLRETSSMLDALPAFGGDNGGGGGSACCGVPGRRSRRAPCARPRKCQSGLQEAQGSGFRLVFLGALRELTRAYDAAEMLVDEAAAAIVGCGGCGGGGDHGFGTDGLPPVGSSGADAAVEARIAGQHTRVCRLLGRSVDRYASRNLLLRVAAELPRLVQEHRRHHTDTRRAAGRRRECGAVTGEVEPEGRPSAAADPVPGEAVRCARDVLAAVQACLADAHGDTGRALRVLALTMRAAPSGSKGGGCGGSGGFGGAGGRWGGGWGDSRGTAVGATRARDTLSEAVRIEDGLVAAWAADVWDGSGGGRMGGGQRGSDGARWVRFHTEPTFAVPSFPNHCADPMHVGGGPNTRTYFVVLSLLLGRTAPPPGGRPTEMATAARVCPEARGSAQPGGTAPAGAVRSQPRPPRLTCALAVGTRTRRPLRPYRRHRPRTLRRGRGWGYWHCTARAVLLPQHVLHNAPLISAVFL